jgi:lipopolysaccharide/colanic/teichoic acid biosynthesis glycosyltransferase
MSRREQAFLTVTLIVLDAIMLAVAFMSAFYVRVESGWLPSRPFGPVEEYMRTSLSVIPLWLLIFGLNRLYDLRLLHEGIRTYYHVIAGCTYGLLALVLTFVATSQGNPVPARGWLVLAWLFSILYVGLVRFVLRRVLVVVRGRGRFVTRVIIVGANAHGQALANQFRTTPGASVDVVGFVDDFLPMGARVGDLRVLGAPAALHELALHHDAKEVILVSTAVAWETFQNLMQQSTAPNGYEILLSPGYYEILTTGVQVSYRDFVPLLRVNKMRITGADALLKTVLDYGLGSVAAILLAPVIAILAALVRINSSGPILDRYLVWGVRGGSFYTYKFRTHLERHQPTTFPVTAEDRRAIAMQHPLTRWMLRLGLDKLPQLINIFTGDMSLVGPRTISRSQDILVEPALANLLTVKPGITGPWAVGGQRTFDEEMRLTTYYIRNWTIWLDIQILLQTVVRILRGERAKAQLPFFEEDSTQ